MIYADYTYDELQVYLKENEDKQNELENKISKLNLGEEENLRMLKEERKAIELLHSSWTGENAERYIMQSYENNEMFQKRYAQAFSHEKDRLQDELKRLQIEAQDISDAMKNKTKEE